MNDILNKDIEAIDIIVKEMATAIKTHEHNYDRTFGSVIFNVNNNNTYTIQDEGGVQRKVKCALPNLILKAGQNVWVKIPGGKLEEMHICGVK